MQKSHLIGPPFVMEKEDFDNESEVLLSDIIKEKLIRKDTEVERVKKEDNELGFRPRTMSDPLCRENYCQTRKNRYPESYGRSGSQCCEPGKKHTHFANSKQIAQSIYPDFLSSIPSENPTELKKIIKKLLTDNEERKCEANVDLTSNGPSKKSLLAWYRREYGLSFDESKANIT